jgi:hypothetical protein
MSTGFHLSLLPVLMASGQEYSWSKFSMYPHNYCWTLLVRDIKQGLGAAVQNQEQPHNPLPQAVCKQLRRPDFNGLANFQHVKKTNARLGTTGRPDLIPSLKKPSRSFSKGIL